MQPMSLASQVQYTLCYATWTGHLDTENSKELLVNISVRPIREFREMPITDINVRTHPITDTDMKVTVWQ